MISNSKKIENYARNLLEQADYLPKKKHMTIKANFSRQRIPQNLDEGEIKILEMMEANVDINYYIKVLQEVEESRKEVKGALQQSTDAKKIQQICYAEIGRRMVRITQKNIYRDFSKSNIYIRGYMMRGILDYIQELVKFCPDSIFVLPNSDKAINFDADERPPEIQKYLEEIQYAEIIRHVNYIIQKNIYKQKYEVPPAYPAYLLPAILFAVVIGMLLLTILISSEAGQQSGILMIITGLILVISFILIFGYILNTFHQSVEVVPVTQLICDEIKHYFDFVNGKTPFALHWSIGEAFFWIEIRVDKSFQPKATTPCTSRRLPALNTKKQRKSVTLAGQNFQLSTSST